MYIYIYGKREGEREIGRERERDREIIKTCGTVVGKEIFEKRSTTYT